MKQHKKEELVAMKFFRTYGWIILVVLTVMGGLAYFGVLKPENFLPETIRTNAWCSDNPDKCVCETKDGYAYSQDLQPCFKKIDNNLKLRKKSQAELDIDDCQNNPREDDKCKCLEYEGDRDCKIAEKLKSHQQQQKAL